MAKHELELVELTNMCMIRDFKTNKVLVQIRNKNDWDGLAFPRGHVEKGESITESVIREVKEETGLTVKNPILCGIKNWYDSKKNKRFMVYLYKTNQYTGDLKDSSNEGENKWMLIPSILKSELAQDSFLEMLDIFLNNDKNQELFYEDTLNNNEDKRWIKKIY